MKKYLVIIVVFIACFSNTQELEDEKINLTTTTNSIPQATTTVPETTTTTSTTTTTTTSTTTTSTTSTTTTSTTSTTTTTTSTTTTSTTTTSTTSTTTTTTSTTTTSTTTTSTTTIPQNSNISSISQSLGACYDGDSKRNSILSVTNNGNEQINYIAEMQIDGGAWEYRGNHYLGIGQTNPTAADAAVSVGSTITWRIQLYKNPSEYYETNILGPSGPTSCP
tara:strand:+ start:343 stop:1008 length:666 start_codon:yes stop_codon:yes gene_type:complete